MSIASYKSKCSKKNECALSTTAVLSSFIDLFDILRLTNFHQVDIAVGLGVPQNALNPETCADVLPVLSNVRTTHLPLSGYWCRRSFQQVWDCVSYRDLQRRAQGAQGSTERHQGGSMFGCLTRSHNHSRQCQIVFVSLTLTSNLGDPFCSGKDACKSCNGATRLKVFAERLLIQIGLDLSSLTPRNGAVQATTRILPLLRTRNFQTCLQACFYVVKRIRWTWMDRYSS